LEVVYEKRKVDVHDGADVIAGVGKRSADWR
jgi:hypothetical protein